MSRISYFENGANVKEEKKEEKIEETKEEMIEEQQEIVEEIEVEEVKEVAGKLLTERRQLSEWRGTDRRL